MIPSLRPPRLTTLCMKLMTAHSWGGSTRMQCDTTINLQPLNSITPADSFPPPTSSHFSVSEASAPQQAVILLHIFPHTIIFTTMCPHASMCPHTTEASAPLRRCSRLSTVRMLLYMFPHTIIYVSSYYYMCPHTTMHVSSYYSVSSYYCVRVLILLCV
jgi:hypothetical protein